VPGVIARISSALHSSNIEIYKSMDSHTAISCLIKKNKEMLGVNVLHKEFKLE
jgi:aspartokinase